MATASKKAAPHPLDTLAEGDPLRVIALMLWVNRLRQPDMYAQINEHDLKGFEDCARYLKVKPQVRIFRPEGLEATPAIPAQGNRRAVPARSATPPKPYVMVTLVDEKGDAIVPVENNQDDFDAQAEAREVRRAKETAQDLAQRLVAQAQSGEYSLSVMQDAANALITLSRAA